MRVLEFTVVKQFLRKKLGCDFDHIVAGSKGYLWASFDFSEEWKGCVKVASFWGEDKVEHAVKLDDADSCMIPPEVLTGDCFLVNVTGAKKPDYKLITRKIKVRQEMI